MKPREQEKRATVNSRQWADYLTLGAARVGCRITPQMCRRFADHARELLIWNRRINLTTIVDPYEIAEKHFIDSLAAVVHIPGGAALLDIGSGGGFPGIPIGVARPDTRVTLLDAKARKVSFLKHVIRTLPLEGGEAIHGRAEVLASHGRQFDVVISRATAALTDLVDLAAKFCRPEGVIVALAGKIDTRQLQRLAGGAPDRSEGLVRVVELQLPYSGAQRCIVRVRKSAAKKVDNFKL